ncbi:hypothetical protein AX14_013335 [Amanita brunnescens Koide BX004]|nr:hypothetical protein AX14_013335 [Amanita brunnescens Koide BX004]
MVLSSSGPPGPKRPKSSAPPAPNTSSASPRTPTTAQILSPVPTRPSTSWFSLLGSPVSLPALQLPSASVAAALPLPAPHREVTTLQPTPLLNTTFVDNHLLITDISTNARPAPSTTSLEDPWARAHARVCAHATQECAACSISLICCSCRSLRYSPGPPPQSPIPTPSHAGRSRSASPALFRNVGNGSPPPFFDQSVPEHDDEAYSRALAECDTCDNSSCVRGIDEPATWTITVEQFDEGLEETYDRTFRACAACNRACKKSFMGYKIKSRLFDNTTRNAFIATQPETTLPRPPTPLEIFAVISHAHNTICSHTFTACSVCSLGILCCQCNKLHTAPARLKLQCTICLHYACATCTTPFCCSCRKPWFPSDSPSLILAPRFRGGARSTKSSKKGSSSSSHSSGPGSLATAHSSRNSPDPFDAMVPPQMPTQSSTDEIDAFADRTIKLSTAIAQDSDVPAAARSTKAPSPSSNLPPASAPVFSRPEPLAYPAMTEDVPTVVPSRAPSRAASIASASSVGDAGIAELLQPDPIAIPSVTPALSDVAGRIHRRYPLASLKVDDEDSRHFLARDNTRIEDIANETEYLLSSNTSWPSILYFLRDTLKFESIQGSLTDFQVLMAGLAEIWADAATFDARAVSRDMIESVRLLPKAEKEIDRLEDVAARYRKERNAARTQLKTTEAELSRLRQAANDTLDSNARLLAEIDQLRATDAVTIARERDEAQSALKDAIAHSKTAMAKQVSRYQHLATIAEERNSRLQKLEKDAQDKDAYILKTERKHAEIYHEREAAERAVSNLQQQLQDATSLFETTREARRHDQEDFDDRTIAFKKHISELNAKLNLLPSDEVELRSLVGLANERAGIAEEEYRKKSTELKLAHKELATLKAKLTATDNAKTKSEKTLTREHTPAKSVRWGFEPSDDAPSSQPFWDHSNEYSKYIASMVAATVTAIPSIPMQTAIATAIETVRAAGPSILSQPASTPPTKTGRASPKPAATVPAGQPQPPTANNASTALQGSSRPRSRAPSPSPAKPVQPASMTFAQMAASLLDAPAAAPLHPAKAKPSWRAIETNKSLVLRPGTKGTRVSELHIRVPKVPATTHLFSLSGTKLINEILRLVNETHNKAGIRALKENHLVLVKWSMRGNLIFKCSKPMDDIVKDCLHDAIKSAVPPSSTDSIAILNKPPTTALKFSSVPRHNEDGTDTDSYDLHNDLMANELWRDVEIFSQPRFLPMKPDAAGGTVIVSVVDDNVGSIGRKLMNSVVNFSGASRRCLRWVEKEAQLHCTQCQTWGHLNYNCLSNIMRCSKCAGPHDYRQHDRYCDTCKSGKGHLCIPKCFNCRGAHFANSKDCIFYLNRSSKERQIQLRDEFSQKWKAEEAALKAAANTDSGRAARSAVVTGIMKSGAKDKGKSRASTKQPQKDDDDYTPVGRGGKAKYTFGGMAKALASTTRIDEVPDDKDGGSDASSDLRLSYLDDIPLKQRFPELKPPAPAPASAPSEQNKPLTITLPAINQTSSKSSRSVTDILRELKKPADAPPTRFGGGEVAYSASALQSEATAFVVALDAANLPSQPSPTPRSHELPTPADGAPVNDLAPAAISHIPTNPHD